MNLARLKRLTICAIKWLIGTSIATVACVFIVWPMVIDAAMEERRMRCAHKLMWEIQPGITDCKQDGCTFNCRYVRKGKVKEVVLAAKE